MANQPSLLTSRSPSRRYAADLMTGNGIHSSEGNGGGGDALFADNKGFLPRAGDR